MTVLFLTCKSFCIFNTNLPFKPSVIYHTTNQVSVISSSPKCPLARTPKCSKILSLNWSTPIILGTHVSFCSKNEVIDEFVTTHLPEMPESEELELLDKPFPRQINEGIEISTEEEVVVEEEEKVSNDEVLEPFYKLFKPREDSLEETSDKELEDEVHSFEEESKKVMVEYYEPKRGDLVVGVVVSGNENKLDLNIGADLLGTMLTKEVLPLSSKEMGYLMCDVEKDAEEFLVRGKMGIVMNDEDAKREPIPGKPVVEPGTVLFAEVLGRTLSGRPLLSTRRLFRRIAWHRVRQIQQLNEPIEVKITEWNTGGLLTRIEGLRAFLPKVELMNRVQSYSDLKENVGRRINVLITRVNEDTNDLILTEKEAWEMLHLREGTLLEGTVMRLFPYGAQIRIGETNRSGLLHISNVSRSEITSINDLLAVGEKVKVMVVKSMFPDKIALSIADLESKPGLFLRDKEKVFSQAKDMAKKYRQKIKAVSATRRLEPLPTDRLPFEDEESLYANWKWFKFVRDNE